LTNKIQRKNSKLNIKGLNWILQGFIEFIKGLIARKNDF